MQKCHFTLDWAMKRVKVRTGFHKDVVDADTGCVDLDHASGEPTEANALALLSFMKHKFLGQDMRKYVREAFDDRVKTICATPAGTWSNMDPDATFSIGPDHPRSGKELEETFFSVRMDTSMG